MAKKVRWFTAERRAAFLEHLRRSGNQAAAARSIGFDRTVPERRRRCHAGFELECRAALAEASARLAGASDPFGHDGEPEFETIRRGAARAAADRRRVASGVRRPDRRNGGFPLGQRLRMTRVYLTFSRNNHPFTQQSPAPAHRAPRPPRLAPPAGLWRTGGAGAGDPAACGG